MQRKHHCSVGLLLCLAVTSCHSNLALGLELRLGRRELIACSSRACSVSGYLAMTIGTHSPFHDMPTARASALLDAVEALKEEHARSDSPLAGRLDVSRFAVAGWSMGGGGCLLAALADPSLKCVLAFAPQ